MHAQTFFETTDWGTLREWFEGEVLDLHASTKSLHRAMGKRLQYFIAHCQNEDIMPRLLRETLQEIGESVLGNANEPMTFKDGAVLLSRCLSRETR